MPAGVRPGARDDSMSTPARTSPSCLPVCGPAHMTTPDRPRGRTDAAPSADTCASAGQAGLPGVRVCRAAFAVCRGFAVRRAPPLDSPPPSAYNARERSRERSRAARTATLQAGGYGPHHDPRRRPSRWRLSPDGLSGHQQQPRDRSRNPPTRPRRRPGTRLPPSAVARGLKTKRTASLGLVVPDIANPFFAEVVRGASEVAWAQDYSVLLCNTDERPEREWATLHMLEAHRVDGLLLVSSRLSDEQPARWPRPTRPSSSSTAGSTGAPAWAAWSSTRSAPPRPPWGTSSLAGAAALPSWAARPRPIPAASAATATSRRWPPPASNATPPGTDPARPPSRGPRRRAGPAGPPPGARCPARL